MGHQGSSHVAPYTRSTAGAALGLPLRPAAKRRPGRRRWRNCAMPVPYSVPKFTQRSTAASRVTLGSYAPHRWRPPVDAQRPDTRLPRPWRGFAGNPGSRHAPGLAGRPSRLVLLVHSAGARGRGCGRHRAGFRPAKPTCSISTASPVSCSVARPVRRRALRALARSVSTWIRSRTLLGLGLRQQGSSWRPGPRPVACKPPCGRRRSGFERQCLTPQPHHAQPLDGLIGKRKTTGGYVGAWRRWRGIVAGSGRLPAVMLALVQAGQLFAGLVGLTSQGCRVSSPGWRCASRRC